MIYPSGSCKTQSWTYTLHHQTPGPCWHCPLPPPHAKPIRSRIRTQVGNRPPTAGTTISSPIPAKAGAVAPRATRGACWRRPCARHMHPTGHHSAGRHFLMVNLPGGQEIYGLHGVRSLAQGAILRLVRLARLKGLSIWSTCTGATCRSTSSGKWR
jgi:hypothetical protein